MVYMIVLLTFVVLIELFFRPRLDNTGKYLLLWYGRKLNRNFKILWTYEKS